MKLQDIFESKKDPVAAIMAAIESVLVRGAVVETVDIQSTEIWIEVAYDFPEHRTGLGRKMSKALTGIAKTEASKTGGDMGVYGMLYQIDMLHPLTPDEMADLKSKVSIKYTSVY